MNDTSFVRNVVKDYYGSTLEGTHDLKTSACCDPSDIPETLKKPLSKIHPEVCSHYYGCGLVAPSLLQGLRVLDLGCGSGRDVYLLSQLVGKKGEVIEVIRKLNRVKIKGINIVKKHEKTTKEKKGGIISKENFIDISNLKNVDSGKKEKIKGATK